MDADMSGVDKQSMALQLLLDERDIIALAARYCRALDTKGLVAAGRGLPP